MSVDDRRTLIRMNGTPAEVNTRLPVVYTHFLPGWDSACGEREILSFANNTRYM